jgi:hypothetical protein
MRCKTCGNGEEFYVNLHRIVQTHAIDGKLLELVVDDEQFSPKGAFICAPCGSVEVELTNDDIDTFWTLFGQRVNRRIDNPRWLSGEQNP